MKPVRYFLALIFVVGLPPMFLYWLLIYPFVNFSRGKRIGMSYGVASET
jgi:hypothetical protein